jgi:hypothetical protein
VGGKAGAFHWRAAYSFVDATFQSSFLVNAESNSTADADGNILVTPGDRIPLVPRSTARLVLDYDATESLNLGANIIYVSGSYLHGDENNANQAGVTNGGRANSSRAADGFPATRSSICGGPTTSPSTPRSSRASSM